MKNLLRKHKIAVIVTCMACLLIAVTAALYWTRSVKKEAEKRAELAGVSHDKGVFDDDIVIHDSTEGEIIIGSLDNDTANIIPLSASLTKTIDNPETIWETDVYAGNHTDVEKAKMKDGSIGVLTIPKIKLSVNVYESPDSMEAMSKGVAHFPSTSAWSSNVGISGHNVNLDGSDGYFKYLYTLEAGDSITYQTALGERSYSVSSVTTINETDWTPLYYSDDNRLTLITCISGQPGKRLCVTALEAVQ